MKIIVILFQLAITLFPYLTDQIQQVEKAFQQYPFVQVLLDQFSTILQSSVGAIWATVENSISNLLKLLLFLFTFIFSLNESKYNRYWFLNFAPKKYRVQWQSIFMKLSKTMGYFLVVEFILFATTLLLVTIAFYFLKIPLFFHFAIIVSIADLLPLLGIGIFFIPIAIYYAAIKKITLSLLYIAIYILLVIIRQLLESKLWASSLHIRTIHSFIIGAASILVFGVYGIILSPILILIAVKMKQSPIFDK